MTAGVIPAAARPIGRIGNDPSRIRGVAIQECGEPLVELTPEPGIFVTPAYHRGGVPSAPDRVTVRSGVRERLRVAAASLPGGVGLLVWDGLRALETQAAIVDAFVASLPADLRDDEEVLKTYLAPPPESEASFREDPPPHSTGGAVDLTLCDAGGRPLDLGAEFDEFTERAWLASFEQRGEVGCRDRRRILYWAMLEAGFAPYPWEYWHYELGTMVAAVFHSAPLARYGAAVPWRAPTQHHPERRVA